MSETNELREAFLSCCMKYTKSESLVKECSKIFDTKKLPDPVVDNKLRLV